MTEDSFGIPLSPFGMFRNIFSKMRRLAEGGLPYTFRPSSSAIASMEYYPIQRRLDIVFTKRNRTPDGKYSYPNVSPNEFAYLLMSNSKGRYFNRHIRPKGIA